MTNKAMVSVPRELLERAVKADGVGVNAVDLVDAWRAVATLKHLLSAPAEDVRAVVDEPVRNQCDGCQAGIPLIRGAHRMGKPGGYPDLLSCTADRYRHPQSLIVMPDADQLAQIIRKVDGDHSLGAGALAEKIIDEYARLNPQ